MRKRNFRFAFEIVLTLIIFAVLAIANILSGAKTTARVEQEIQEARGLTSAPEPSFLGADWEDGLSGAKNP